MKSGKKLLFIVHDAANNKIKFIYKEGIKMGGNWEKTFDPLYEFKKIINKIYRTEPENSLHGLLVKGETMSKSSNGTPDVWESDFSLVGLVGIYNDGGIFEWEEVEDFESGETYRLSKLTSVPIALGLSLPVNT